MALVLHSYWRSSCSWRVRLALNLKGLSYDTVSVHLVKDGGEQHQAPHRQMNPMRELPVLMLNDQPIAQSMAILEFLEESYPEPSLLPSTPLDRARVRQMAELINSGIQPRLHRGAPHGAPQGWPLRIPIKGDLLQNV